MAVWTLFFFIFSLVEKQIPMHRMTLQPQWNVRVGHILWSGTAKYGALYENLCLKYSCAELIWLMKCFETRMYHNKVVTQDRKV